MLGIELVAQRQARACGVLRAVYGIAPIRQDEALLDLISAALKEDRGSVSSPPEVGAPTYKQWARWTALRDRRPDILIRVLEAVMLREDSPVPGSNSPDEIAYWAAQVAELALDELDLSLPY